jgi:hypothetical protein
MHAAMPGIRQCLRTVTRIPVAVAMPALDAFEPIVDVAILRRRCRARRDALLGDAEMR